MIHNIIMPFIQSLSKHTKKRHRFLWIKAYLVKANIENSERYGNTRPPDLPLEKSAYRSGSNS